jgi:hypothetical protein
MEGTMLGIRRRVLRVILLLLFALTLVSQATPAFATTDDYHCFEDLGACYGRAATRDSWISMWLAGLDCELTFAHCVETALVY